MRLGLRGAIDKAFFIRMSDATRAGGNVATPVRREFLESFFEKPAIRYERWLMLDFASLSD
jgi:hypothetical protein